MPAVLIVDDEANIRRMLAAVLEAEGHDTAQAADGLAALSAIERQEPDVVLLDLALPDRNGTEVLGEIRSRWPALPVVMVSGQATLGDAVRATKLGAFHFIEKPVSPDALLLTVSSAVELRRARALSRELARELGGGARLVGSSAAMRRTRELIARIALADARVMITGESGTGKELAALALHEQSARAAGPFVRVNSAAIPPDLVESEMFGHEKGAFTGASAARRGRFELADGGTLFLDEVADLPAAAQAKLLRAVELGEIERVGGSRTIAVDVRVIAATNHDLAAAVAAGRFREDLYYRLNVMPLPMPPLRERSGDIGELVDHLMERIRIRDGLTPPVLNDKACERLRAYPWPGNVRELANVCERLAILFSGRSIGDREVGRLLGPVTGVGSDERVTLSERLDRFERDLIARSLADSSGSVADAARRLHTDRANLYRRMRRLGIER